MTRRLSRAAGDAAPAAPVRLVHLGVGNFFRAHQAWYTQRANDASSTDPWGYAAFTGRSAAIADDLEPQDGLYTLVTQGAEGNDYDVIASLSAVHPSEDLAAWRRYFASPELAIVTSTVTEAGYCRDASGGLAVDDPKVAADIAALTEDTEGGTVSTAPGKFVAGLLARRAADAGKLTFVPCDNVPDNGEMVERVVGDLAAAVDPSLTAYIDENVTFVTTMVDRITPRATEADREAVRRDTGIDDPAVVVTEPFAEWVLQGEFAAGRPAWDAAGATIVDDLRPFEQRKLWLLNGSHSLMAYAATIVGHETVSDAIADERVAGWVDEWWDVAARHLTLPAQDVQSYRDALVERYSNPNIRHLLAQIASDGSQKIAIRIVPALKADRTAGEMPTGATRAVAAWVLHLRGVGAPVADAHASEVQALVGGSLDESVDAVLGYLGLSDDAQLRDVVLAQARELEQLAA